MSEPTEHTPVRAYLVLAFGLACITASPILVRLASEAPGEVIAVWRTNIGALLLAPFALRRIGPELRGFSARDRWLIAGSGVILAFHFITWIESLYHTSVASASVLVTMSPIFLALLGYLFLGERITLRTGVAIGLAVAGAVLIGLGDAGEAAAANSILGNGLALGSAVLVSLYMIIGRIVRQHASWMGYVFPVYAVVAVTTLGFALAMDVPLLGYSWKFYGLCVLMALGPHLLGHGSINYAVKYINVALIGLLTLLEPVGASFFAYVLFGEVPTWLSLGGMILVLVSVAAALVRRRRTQVAS